MLGGRSWEEGYLELGTGRHPAMSSPACLFQAVTAEGHKDVSAEESNMRTGSTEAIQGDLCRRGQIDLGAASASDLVGHSHRKGRALMVRGSADAKLERRSLRHSSGEDLRLWGWPKRS